MLSSFKDRGLIWPLIIVSLLLSSVGLMVGVVFMAKSDGGAQVVDEYYERAVAWDSLSSMDSAFNKRGWLAYLMLDKSSGRLVVQDSLASRVSEMSGTVEMTRPQSSATGVRNPFHFSSADSTFLFETGTLSPGLWDFAFQATYEEQILTFTLRKEVR